MATIKPHAVETWTHKQSQFPHVPELPLRMVCLGPSGSGKTVFMASLILDVYPNAWERIYVFSPTVLLDSTWTKIRDCNRDVLKVPEKEVCFFPNGTRRPFKGSYAASTRSPRSPRNAR